MMIASLVVAAVTYAQPFARPLTYSAAENAMWSEVRAAGTPRGPAQLSVHVPLGKMGASSQIMCDAAFNCWKLNVPPNIRTQDAACEKIVREQICQTLNFAFDAAPFVADYRQSVWSRAEGGYPIVRGELDAICRHYALEYCSDPATGELYVRGRVTNTGFMKGRGVVRVRRAAPRESAIMDYHYIGFRWNAAKWSTGGDLPPPVCTAVSNAVAAVEESWSVDDSAFGMHRPGFWGSPYVAEDQMRLHTGGNVLKIEQELEPGESFTFTISAGFADTPIATHPDFDALTNASRTYWDALLPVKADFGTARENDIFRTQQMICLQMLMNTWKDPAEPMLQPCQGGSSERFYVWVWEASASLRPMVRLGHFEAVRKVLDYILTLQDSDTPPEGNFTTVKGAIGTTGPRWTSSTGAALMLAADYLMLSGDEAFAKEHLDAFVRAAEWSIGEVKATRKTDADGKRILGWGLMPSCKVDDGNKGIFFTDTDSYNYAGLRRLTDYLIARGDPRAEELDREVKIYKETIDRTLAENQQADGFIPPQLGDGHLSFEFRNIPAGIEFLSAGVYDPARDEPIVRAVRRCERVTCDGPFVEVFDAHIKYIGNYEGEFANFYQQRGEWKRAYLARQAFMNYAMTRDLYVTSERYSEVDPCFTPWQPNASNSGRAVRLMADRFLTEGASRIVLLGGFAPFEFGDISIDGLYTRYGRFSLARRGGELTAKWERPLPAGQLILIPEDHEFKPRGGVLTPVAPSVWKVSRETNVIKGSVRN